MTFPSAAAAAAAFLCCSMQSFVLYCPLLNSSCSVELREHQLVLMSLASKELVKNQLLSLQLNSHPILSMVGRVQPCSKVLNCRSRGKVGRWCLWKVGPWCLWKVIVVGGGVLSGRSIGFCKWDEADKVVAVVSSTLTSGSPKSLFAIGEFLIAESIVSDLRDLGRGG